MRNIDFFFNPKSIAIIGASDTPRFGYTTTKYLLNSKFKTYPVNLTKSEILGHKAYKNINDIPNNIELVIILVGNDQVLQAIKDCIKKGVKGIIIESAGFAETGIDKYIKLQEEIVNIVKESNIRIIGPNCVGLVNFHNQFTSSEVNFKEEIKGNISIIAQSGVLGNVFIDWGTDQRIGFSKAITLGNKIDVDEVDILEYLNNDPETKVITVYLEGTKRGKEFIDVLKKMTKPVLILKNGRSDIGSVAVKSHTSSIAGNDRIYDGVFKQHHGIFRVNNFYEMFNIAQIFSTQPLPNGKNIAVITGSGSLGILACDEITNQGLSLAKLDKDTINEIKNIIPNWVSIGGTIDLGPSQIYTLIPSLKAVFKDKNVDCVLFIFTVPKGPLQEFEALNTGIKTSFRLINNLTKSLNKPIVIVVFGSRWVFEFVTDIATKFKIPVIEHLEHALKAFKLMYEYNPNLKNKFHKELN
jgi:acyl-CoA synthetase (NDP forming)